jgi:circadian clock protein KaiC
MSDETETAGVPDDHLARMPSGIPGLDTVLRGGFIKNGIYIIQGRPGAGKTILGNQICFAHAASGGRALYVTLLSEQHHRMIANIEGLSFFDRSKIAHELHYVSAFSILEKDGFQGLLTLIRREIVSHGISVLIIDGLVAAEHLAPSELELKKFIHELQTQAATGDCTMFLLTSARNAVVSPEHTMVDGMIEIADREIGWRVERDILVKKFRGSSQLRGHHAMRITDEGITVFPRLESMRGTPIHPLARPAIRHPSGIPGLDAIMGNGLAASSTTLVLGPTGVGKTTLGLQFLAGSSTEEPGMMLGFYETPDDIARRAVALNPELGKLIDSGAVQLAWQGDVEDVIDRIAGDLLVKIKQFGIKRLFVDGLLAFRHMALEPERIAGFYRALSNELRALGVLTVMTMELPDLVGPQVRAPVDNLTILAENILLMRYVEYGSRLHRVISILKVRDSGFDPMLRRFEIGGNGIEIGDSFGVTEDILSGYGHLPKSAPSRAPDRG